MSNAFMGQRQQASPMGFGGYSGGGLGQTGETDPFSGFDGGMGRFNPFAARFTDDMGSYGGGMGGFGNYSPQPQPYNPAAGRGFGDGGMGGFGTTFGNFGIGGGGGYGGGMRAPAYEPTINDAFSRYFSQQYYGGPAFDPFAATSFFGGGYGGGFGFGGGGRRGGGMGGRMRRRRQMFEDLFQPENTPLPQPITARDDLARIQPMPIGGGAYQPGGGGQRIEMGPVTPQPDLMMRPAVMPQPYMGEVDSIMPVQMQDTPVQSAPMFYEPPQMQPYAPSPFASPFSRPGRDMFTNFRMR